MNTFFKIALTIIVIAHCQNTNGAMPQESLAARYASLESKFLLLMETASARSPEESLVARQVLTESRRREIVSRLKLLASALQENRLSEATTLFQALESDLDAVEQLLTGTAPNKTAAKTSDAKPDSLPDVPNSSRQKNDDKKNRDKSASSDQKRLAIQLLFRLKELQSRQLEIHAWIDTNTKQTGTVEVANSTARVDAAKRMSQAETTIAMEATRLADTAARDKTDSLLATLIKGIGTDAGDLAKLLDSGERRGDWTILSNLILASLKCAIDKLEKRLENDPAQNESNTPAPKPQPSTDSQTGSPEDYIPSLDELLMIRQMQERIAKRIVLCEQWGKSHPEKNRELERALHDLTQEQLNVIEILRGK
ncbi:MAG: hypothetical protein PHQ75_12975 [Thermoguttaceae bacterium]|nr:hypothetical protein [Thermoguttaceae bacterium]